MTSFLAGKLPERKNGIPCGFCYFQKIKLAFYPGPCPGIKYLGCKNAPSVHENMPFEHFLCGISARNADPRPEMQIPGHLYKEYAHFAQSLHGQGNSVCTSARESPQKPRAHKTAPRAFLTSQNARWRGSLAGCFFR